MRRIRCAITFPLPLSFAGGTVRKRAFPEQAPVGRVLSGECLCGEFAMRYRTLSAVSGLALSAFLAGAAIAADNERVDANGLPTTHSTPAEHAQTAELNNQIGVTDSQAPAPAPQLEAQAEQAQAQSDQNNAQYQQQQQQYQQQLQQHQQALEQNKVDQQRFENRTAAYQALRARYAAERAAYHRGIWPDRYVRWTLEEYSPALVGQRVEIINGDRVGTVVDVARTPAGRVEALLVRLDNDKVVWIDQADIRYDRAGGIVMTNLDRTDLRRMADQRA